MWNGLASGAMTTNDAGTAGQDAGKLLQANGRRLILRLDLETTDVKYNLINTPAKTSHKRLVQVQAQRYCIGRIFWQSDVHDRGIVVQTLNGMG